MEYNLFNTPVTITEKQIARANVVKVFGEFADIAEELTKIAYVNKINTYSDLLKDNGSIILYIVNSFFEPTMKYIISQGIYDFSDSDLINKFKEENDIGKSMEEILAPFDEIIQENNSMQEYRELRKESRGRVIGGGFGFEGAVKGMATAGAMNLAAGIGHSIFNSIGNALDSASAKSRMEELFKNEDLIENYSRIAFNAIGVIEKIVLSLFEKRDLIALDDGKSSKDSSLFENLKKGRLPKSEVPKIYLSLLKNAPYESDYYDWGIENFPEYADSLTQMRDTLCYDFQFMSRSIENVDSLTKFDKAVLEMAKNVLGIDYLSRLTTPPPSTTTENEANVDSTTETNQTVVLNAEEKKAIEQKKEKDESLDMATICVGTWLSLFGMGLYYFLSKTTLNEFLLKIILLGSFLFLCLVALCGLGVIGNCLHKAFVPDHPTIKSFKGMDIVVALFTIIPCGLICLVADEKNCGATFYVSVGLAIITAIATISGIFQILMRLGQGANDGEKKDEPLGTEVSAEEPNPELPKPEQSDSEQSTSK